MRTVLYAVVSIGAACWLVVIPPAEGCGKRYSEEELSDDLAEVGEQIELLWSGTVEERTAIAEEPWPRFAPYWGPIPAAEGPVVADQVDSLRRWIAVESDDRIVRGVLSHLSGIDLEELNPLFREVLDHPSANLRWIAVERFVRFRDPAALDSLRHLWRAERSSRIRVEIAQALAAHGDADAAGTWRAWLDDPRPTLVEAGLRSLARVADEESLETVARLARDGDTKLRLTAIRLLSSWAGNETALEAVLQASAREDRTMRAAIRSLAAFDDDRARERLVEIAEGRTDLARVVMLELTSGEAPASRSVLQRVEAAMSARHRKAWLELHGTRPSGSASDDDAGDGSADPAEKMLQRASPTGMEPLHRDPAFDGDWRVMSPPGARSVRCFARVAKGGWTALLGRLPHGAKVIDPVDRFEFAGGSWVLARAEDHRYCWLRAEEIARPDQLTEAPSESAPASVRELDLPVEELATRSFGILRERGLIETFDPAEDVVGVRLRSDLSDPTSSRAFLSAFDEGARVLDVYLVRELRAVPPGRRDGDAWKKLGTADERFPEDPRLALRMALFSR